MSTLGLIFYLLNESANGSKLCEVGPVNVIEVIPNRQSSFQRKEVRNHKVNISYFLPVALIQQSSSEGGSFNTFSVKFTKNPTNGGGKMSSYNPAKCVKTQLNVT